MPKTTYEAYFYDSKKELVDTSGSCKTEAAAVAMSKDYLSSKPDHYAEIQHVRVLKRVHPFVKVTKRYTVVAI